MDYQKVTIKITPFQNWLRDVLNSQLAEIGFDSFVELEDGFDAFIPAKDYSVENTNTVLQAFAEGFSFDVQSEFVKDQNWNKEWEKNFFKPLVIGGEWISFDRPDFMWKRINKDFEGYFKGLEKIYKASIR